MNEQAKIPPCVLCRQFLLADMSPGLAVLDIGCGAGLLFSLMAGLGFEFEGLETRKTKRSNPLKARQQFINRVDTQSTR